jgi:transposase
VTSLTGLAIIDAICKGEMNPEKLASFRHGNCKKSEQEIAKALQSNGRKDLLFSLTHEYELYQIFQGKIIECDKQIQKLLNEQINNDDNKKQHHIDGKVPKATVQVIIYQLFNWL